MNLSRRNFLGGMVAGAATLAATGCMAKCCKAKRPGKVAVQLYSIREYIKTVGLEKALADVASIGYEGVEFAGYWNFKPEQIKKMLDDNGLVACGTHVHRNDFSPEKYKATCEFNRSIGNTFICCPGGGNMPPNCGWDGKHTPSQKLDDFVKMLCDYYNEAAQNCAKYGCKVGFHNHEWEYRIKMLNGETFWDRFFANTDKAVLMEQDVGWTTSAGYDPCQEYVKYPGRSFTLHAKENGSPDAILGQKPSNGKTPVNWDALFPITDKDNVQWYVVECERHCNSLKAITSSYDFLKSKGRTA